jgi:hypothetical protein
MKAAELADELGITTHRAYHLTRLGEFDDFLVEIGERQYRYRPEGLAAYIERGGKRAQRREQTMSAEQHA